ncbi:DUF4870 domain-containing protein [Actinomadura rupiterrae]|uniref:DUF4870 domain-containing protein n=1 Tax=Actinomadura rupiterrae TaxID=559627 RepID=UPI0020A5A540|nr:DUF4870 domain-containing protein [Actinomadura rupiterrae]MCP2339643.1 hypothetical protein [Actinomadura rupiterrae]
MNEQPPPPPPPPPGGEPPQDGFPQDAPPVEPPPHPSPYGAPQGYGSQQGYGQQGSGSQQGYDPRYGYGPPGVPPYGPGPGGPVNKDDTNMVVLSYVLLLFVGFLAPLVIYLIKKNTSPFVRHHAAQALNYQLTMLIHLVVVGVVCAVPAIITRNPAFLVGLVPVYLELLVTGWVLPIYGAVTGGRAGGRGSPPSSASA